MERTPDSDSSDDGKKTTGVSEGYHAPERAFMPEQPRPVRQGLIFERMVQHGVGEDSPAEKAKDKTATDKEEDKDSKKKTSTPQWPAPQVPRIPLVEGQPSPTLETEAQPQHVEYEGMDAEEEDEDNEEESTTQPTAQPATHVTPAPALPKTETTPTPSSQPQHETPMPISTSLPTAETTHWQPPRENESIWTPQQTTETVQPIAENDLPPIHTPDYPAPHVPGVAETTSMPTPPAAEQTAASPAATHSHEETLFDYNAPNAPAAANAMSGNLPPMPPANQPPSPNNANFYNGPYNPNFATTAMNPNLAGPIPQPRSAIEQAPAPHVIEKGSGWGPALAVGLVERHFRRKEDKKLRKQNEKLAKQQTIDQASQQRIERAQAETNSRLQQQQQEMRRMSQYNQQERFNNGAAPFSASQPNMYPGAENRFATAPSPQVRPEQASPTSQPLKPETQPHPDQADAEQTLDYTQFEDQKPVRIEQDAWRRYKVDKHGREIVPAEGHGQAYRQERQQEVLQDRIAAATPMNTRSHAAGAAPALGAFAAYGHGRTQSGTTQQQFGNSSLPSGMTTPSLPQGMPTQADPQHRLPATDQAQKDSVSGVWFWVMIGIIVAAFFAAALI